MESNECKHIFIKFICETTFGHGDSSTEIECICKECGAMGIVVQRNWPATYENMRLAQDRLMKGEKGYILAEDGK